MWQGGLAEISDLLNPCIDRNVWYFVPADVDEMKPLGCQWERMLYLIDFYSNQYKTVNRIDLDSFMKVSTQVFSNNP